jgi:hypothetical protein
MDAFLAGMARPFVLLVLLLAARAIVLLIKHIFRR